MVREFVADLEADPPQFILDTSSVSGGQVPPLDPRRRAEWQAAPTANPSFRRWKDEASGPQAAAVFDLFDRNYRLVGPVGADGWLLYEYAGQR
jgi:hypothetical protein